MDLHMVSAPDGARLFCNQDVSAFSPEPDRSPWFGSIQVMDPTVFLHLPHPRLRAPRNRSACLWHLLNLASRGHRFHTSGVIHDVRKVPGFVDKMHVRYGVLLSPSGQRKRRASGYPTARLVVYRDWDGGWCWWLLFAGPEARVRALTNAHREAVQDAERTDGRLRFRDEYMLRPRQRPREQGGGRAWTWFMTRKVQQAVERELVALAAGHGQRRERTDDLLAAVRRLRQRPMFGGVRNQASHALLRASRVWHKTHGTDVPLPREVYEPLALFNGRIRIYE